MEFLFGTGCRTGEAFGLRWKHLSHDCSSVWIGESISREVSKATKTNKSRDVKLTPKLQEMLMVRRGENLDPESLVFPTPTGLAIDDHNFSRRAWKSVLGNVKVPYRKLYNTRHTASSHCLEAPGGSDDGT
ncbi:MAG: tyrosine-type recombinase/integrase [Cyanobacteriota bacterium]|nr:tyrosine-type recombinase/integrase [Cyanobacteriota bacterium]